MDSLQLDFKSVNQYIPHILLVGIGIGTANFIIHGEFNWLQWLIQAISTSFLIGFTLLWIASNKAVLKFHLQQNWKLYPVLMIFFFLIGILATEIESLIKNLIFLNKAYIPFSSIDILLSNSIISIFLGFSFFLNNKLFSVTDGKEKKLFREDTKPEFEIITKVPVKQGENIQLIPTQHIVYFEAYDNYAHLYHSDGTKILCDYSLIFLEKRLSKNFIRIHRKYILNETYIKQIIPHLNGRYIIQFNDSKLDPITSSKGYLKTMKKLVKIE